MKTIVIANQKGGIGKTTTATTLASILESKGYRTLFIDADKQCNSTDTYRAISADGIPTLYDVILDEDDPCSIKEAIQKTEIGEIVPSDKYLRKADKILYDNVVDGLFKLKEALYEIENEYDYVVIDTAPSIDSILNNCLIAADSVIVPITADRYAIQGLSQLIETIRAIKKRYNQKLSVAGLLLVKFKERTRLSRDVKDSLEEVTEKLGTRLFKTTIRETVKVSEAQIVRQKLIEYAPSCTAAKDYISFVEEFLEGEQ